jgi:hypothetical protein
MSDDFPGIDWRKRRRNYILSFFPFSVEKEFPAEHTSRLWPTQLNSTTAGLSLMKWSGRLFQPLLVEHNVERDVYVSNFNTLSSTFLSKSYLLIRS